tara:strand:+ start:142 stop:378 length:237 start_codon:yes stop_codon:yes gene_type:complete
MKNYEIHYDEEADFLEVFFGEPTQSTAEEIEADVFVRRDEQTNEVKSVMIFGFKKRAGILKEILEKINMRLPLNVNID